MSTPLLKLDYNLLVVATSQLSNMASRTEAPDPLESLHLRRTFGILLVSYLKNVMWEKYPERLASPDPCVAAEARAAVGAAAALAHEFADYSQRWTNDTISLGWAFYCRDTAELIRSLRAFLAGEQRDREEQELETRGPRIFLARIRPEDRQQAA